MCVSLGVSVSLCVGVWAFSWMIGLNRLFSALRINILAISWGCLTKYVLQMNSSVIENKVTTPDRKLWTKCLFGLLFLLLLWLCLDRLIRIFCWAISCVFVSCYHENWETGWLMDLFSWKCGTELGSTNSWRQITLISGILSDKLGNFVDSMKNFLTFFPLTTYFFFKNFSTP